MFLGSASFRPFPCLVDPQYCIQRRLSEVQFLALFRTCYSRRLLLRCFMLGILSITWGNIVAIVKVFVVMKTCTTWGVGIAYWGNILLLIWCRMCGSACQEGIPILCCNFVYLIILIMYYDQDVSYTLGSSIFRQQLSSIHTSTFIISLIWPPPSSFWSKSTLFLYSGSCAFLGQNMACMTVVALLCALSSYS